MPVELMWLGGVLLAALGTLIFALAAPNRSAIESAERSPVRPSEIRR